MLQHTGLRFLLPYMRPYRSALIVGTIYAFVGAGASALSPTVVGWAVDELLAGVRLSLLALYALALLLLAGTLAIFRYRLRMLTGNIAAGVSYQMSQDLYDRLLLFDQATLHEYGIGDLLSRGTTDFIYIWRFYSAGFQMSMHALFLLAIGSTLMAFTNLTLALLIVFMLLLIMLVQLRLGRILERAFDQVQRRMAEISAFAQEHLSAIRVLTSYAQEDAAVAHFRRGNELYTQQTISFVVRSNLISPLPTLVVRLAATLILVVGGMLIIEGRLSIGQYVQFIIYLGLMAGATLTLSQAYERLQQGSAAAGRIGEVLRRGPRVVDQPQASAGPVQGGIHFEDACLHLGGRPVLDSIAIEIPPGTTLGIVGATGAGKSTLLSLVGRIRDPDRGRVLIGGQDVRSYQLAALRQAIVYVPQETFLFGKTLRENITLGLPDVSDERVIEALELAGLSKDLAQLQLGLDTIIGERGATLSGGQKQRAAIARALVRDPRILLLDDALSNVDASTAAAIVAALGRARSNRTCLIVSQKLAAVRDADQIIVIDAGRIVERGTHASLLQQAGLYAAMYRREADQLQEQIEE